MTLSLLVRSAKRSSSVDEVVGVAVGNRMISKSG
jgi:hypothetical protein